VVLSVKPIGEIGRRLLAITAKGFAEFVGSRMDDSESYPEKGLEEINCDLPEADFWPASMMSPAISIICQQEPPTVQPAAGMATR
jgi:hypothetical protein